MFSAKQERLENTSIMGVINVTPDSFSDGGRFLEPNKALQCANHQLVNGADILDLGAQSTRPGAEEVGKEVCRSDREVKTPEPRDMGERRMGKSPDARGLRIFRITINVIRSSLEGLDHLHKS